MPLQKDPFLYFEESIISAATTSQVRLNNLLTLHIHKENALMLNLADIGNDFISAKENRKTMFGKF